ncbi:MAG: DUF748 domain-containing protein [bacterium]
MSKIINYLYKFIRVLGLAVIILTVATSIGTFLFYQTYIPQKTIKEVLEYQIRKKIDPSFSIGIVSGDLLKHIVLEDIQCAEPNSNRQKPFLNIKKLVITYNIWDLFKKENGVISSLKKIDCIGATIIIRRNQDGKIPIVLQEPSRSRKFKNFQAKVNVTDSTWVFEDERGLIPKRQKKTFKVRVDKVDIAALKDVKEDTINIKATGKLTHKKFVLTGSIDQEKQLTFKVKNIDLTKFTGYFIPFRGYKLNEGKYDLLGHIGPLNLGGQPLLKVDIRTNLKNMKLDTPFFKSKFQQTQGEVFISNTQLIKSNLELKFGLEKANDYWKKLRKNKVINQEGQLQNYHQEQVAALPLILRNELKQRRLYLGLNEIKANLEKLPVKGQGYIDLLGAKINLKIESNKSDITGFKEVFPYIKKFNYTGVGDLRCDIEGKLKKPNVHGQLFVQKGSVLGARCKQVDIHYRIKNNQLEYKVPTGELMSNALTANGKINLLTKHFTLSLLTQINAKNIVNKEDVIKGKLNIETEIKGDGSSLHVHAVALPVSASSILQQHIDFAKIDATFSPYTNLYDSKGIISLNEKQDTLVLRGTAINSNQINLTIQSKESHHIDTNIQALIETDKQWLKDPKKYTKVKGELQVQNVQIKNIKLDHMGLQADWDKQRLNIHKMIANKNESRVIVNGQITSSRNIMLNLEEGSRITISDHPEFWKRQGILHGKLTAHGKMYGQLGDLKGELWIKGDTFTSRFINLDKFRGQCRYRGRRLFLDELRIQYQGDIYQASVHIDEIPKNILHLKNPIKHINYKANLNIKEGEMKNLIGLFEQINSETETKSWLNKIQKTKDNPKTQLFKLQDPYVNTKNWVLFNKSNKNSLIFFQDINQSQNQTESFQTWKLSKKIKGKIKGNIQIESQKEVIPSINCNVTISNAKILKYRAENINVNIRGKDQKFNTIITIKDANITKKRINKLRIKGELHNKKTIFIQESFIQGENISAKNWILGQIGLTKNIETKFKWHFQGDEINALSLLIPHIDAITNKGKFELNFKGNKEETTLTDGVLNFEDFSLSQNGHEMKIANETVFINNNNIYVPSLNIQVIQEKNRKKRNIFPLQVKGRATLSLQNNENDGTKIISDLDFMLADIHKKIILSKLYKGKISIKNTRLQGRLTHMLLGKNKKKKTEYTQKEMPRLKGKIELEKGLLTLTNTPKKRNWPNIALDMECQINRNIYLESSFLGEGLLAGLTIDFELQKSLIPINIAGTLNRPKLYNNINLEGGHLTLLNTEFELISPEEQKTYINISGRPFRENKVIFEQKKDKDSLNMPKLQLRGLAIIENEQITTQNNIELPKKYTHVFMSIQGELNHLDEFQFDIFESDEYNKGTKQLSLKKNYKVDNKDNKENQNALLTLLLPGLSYLDETQQNNKQEIIEEFGKQRVNLIFRKGIRPVEKKIAQKTGLEELHLEYNLSQALFEGNAQNMGINIRKKIYEDRLFLALKTQLDFDPKTTQQNIFELSEAEFNYFMLKNLSLNVGAQKENDAREYQAKFSLRYSHAY